MPKYLLKKNRIHEVEITGRYTALSYCGYIWDIADIVTDNLPDLPHCKICQAVKVSDETRQARIERTAQRKQDRKAARDVARLKAWNEGQPKRITSP